MLPILHWHASYFNNCSLVFLTITTNSCCRCSCHSTKHDDLPVYSLTYSPARLLTLLASATCIFAIYNSVSYLVCSVPSTWLTCKSTKYIKCNDNKKTKRRTINSCAEKMHYTTFCTSFSPATMTSTINYIDISYSQLTFGTNAMLFRYNTPRHSLGSLYL